MPEKTHTLSIFHAITGCDTTSKLKVKREKIAWETRNAFPDVPQALLPLMFCRHCYPWCSAGTATPDVLQALLPLMFCRHCYPWCSAGIPVPDVLQAFLSLMVKRNFPGTTLKWYNAMGAMYRQISQYMIVSKGSYFPRAIRFSDSSYLLKQH